MEIPDHVQEFRTALDIWQRHDIAIGTPQRAHYNTSEKRYSYAKQEWCKVTNTN